MFGRLTCGFRAPVVILGPGQNRGPSPHPLPTFAQDYQTCATGNALLAADGLGSCQAGKPMLRGVPKECSPASFVAPIPAPGVPYKFSSSGKVRPIAAHGAKS